MLKIETYLNIFLCRKLLDKNKFKNVAKEIKQAYSVGAVINILSRYDEDDAINRQENYDVLITASNRARTSIMIYSTSA